MTCPACHKPFTPRRPHQVYCCAKCRAAASRARKAGFPAVIRSVRRLKSGTAQVILHVPPLWAQEAHVRGRGDVLELVGNRGRG